MARTGIPEIRLADHRHFTLDRNRLVVDKGITAEKTDPTPNWLCSERLPPSNSANFLDRESPGSVPLSLLHRIVNLGELLKDALLILGGDADTGIGYRESHGISLRGERSRDPHGPPLGEFQGIGNEIMKLCRIWKIFPSSVERGGIPAGSSNTRRTDSFSNRGRNMPRKALNKSLTSNSTGWTTTFPASIFARSSRSLTRPERLSAALRMNRTCFSCSYERSPSIRSRRFGTARESNSGES